MNDTPRTDAACKIIRASGTDWHHSATRLRLLTEELERENNRLREVMQRVSKEADFSQCPGLEGEVDAVLAK